MKVNELIEILKQLPQDAEVIMSSDAEGNNYSPLDGFSEGTIHPEDVGNYHIDAFYNDQHTDDECELEPGERDDFAKVICFFPMN